MTQNDSLLARARAVTLAVLLMAVLALGFAHPAMAAQAAQKGFITLTQHDPSQTPIGGGKAAIYQVGVISGSSYQYVGDFASIGDDLTSHIPKDPDKEKVDSSYLDRLESIARESGAPLQTVDIDAKGQATFNRGEDGSVGLEPGAYLVVQTQPAPGYNSFDRFLVTLPWYGKGQTDPYNINASPKLDPVTSTTPGNPGGGTPSGNNPGTNPSGDSGTTNPASETTPTAGGTLPQTGQLWWPVAVLGVAGAVLVVAGKRSNGKRAHEA